VGGEQAVDPHEHHAAAGEAQRGQSAGQRSHAFGGRRDYFLLASVLMWLGT
jgi:hypothetical protein